MNNLLFKYISIFACILFLFIIFNPLKIDKRAYGANTIQVCDGISYSKPVEPHPLNDKIWITGYENPLFSGPTAPFVPIVNDGEHLWIIPHGSSGKAIVKFNLKTGSMTKLSLSGMSGSLFTGGVYDGTYLWLTPYDPTSIIRIKVSDNSIVKYPINFSFANITMKFFGCSFDGRYVWMMPYYCNRFLRVDTQTATIGQMEAYSITSPEDRGNLVDSGGKLVWFKGAVFDGANMWAVPQNSDRIVRILQTDTPTPSFVGYPIPNTDGYSGASTRYAGGVYAKGYVWFAPNTANKLTRIDPSNANIKHFDISSSTIKNNYTSLSFDGDNIWLIQESINLFVKYNIDSNTFTSYDFSGPNTTNIGTLATVKSRRGRSITFDGTNMWISPVDVDRLIKISPANSLSGKVVEKLTQDPIAGATVRLESKLYKNPDDISLGKLYYFTAVTDAEGNYNKFLQTDKEGNPLGTEVSYIPIGEYIVRAGKDGYDLDDSYNPEIDTLNVEASPAINTKDLKLIKRRKLSIRQVVLNSKPDLHVPDGVYINLQNITLDDSLPYYKTYDLKAISSIGITSAPNYSEVLYTDTELPIKSPYYGYYLNNIIPMNYRIIRFDIGKAINDQTLSLDKKIDLTTAYEFYATVFIEPITQNPEPPYSKMTIRNILGKVKHP